MAKLTESEVLARVNNEFSSSMGAPNGEISVERANAWRFYRSEPFGTEVDGFSKIVTSDVSDVVDGIMPSMLRLFTTVENLVSFEPIGAEDQEQAQQESDYVNHVFFKDNDAFMLLYTWFFDALVQKNGIVKAWWDNSEKVTQETYEGLTIEEVAVLFEDKELEPVERSERPAQTVVNGQVVDGVVHDITFKRVAKGGSVTVDNVAPENYRISSDARTLNPSDARMVGEEFEMTRSDLIGMGFEEGIVNNLPHVNQQSTNSEEKQARNNNSDDLRQGDPDHSQQLIRYREAYIRLDMEGDGKSELRQVTIGGEVLLLDEFADRSIFHVISPQPLPHKHFGTCPAEKVMDNQLVTSTILRQTLDNLYRTNQPSHGVYEAAISENTMDDLLTTQVGTVNRFDRPMSEAYMPMTVPFTAAASFPMLEFFEKWKQNKTGVNADGDGLNPEQLKNIQTSVLMQANDLSRMKIEAYARIFAETGIKSLFLHIHELLLKHQKKERVVKLRNKWVRINPSSWRTRENMSVNIGLGVGSRESNTLHLNQIKELQAAMVAGGGLDVTVTPQNIFNMASQIVRNANFKDPEEFFTNPGAKQFQPKPPDPQQQALIEIQQRQQQLDAADLQQKAAKEENRHQEVMIGLAQDQKEGDDKTAIALETILTKVLELELKFEKELPVPELRFDSTNGLTRQ